MCIRDSSNGEDNVVEPAMEKITLKSSILKMTPNAVVVVGSCMIDFVSYAPRLPRPGETIHGSRFVTNFGGKGANQCVAAAKLGCETALVARVGDDSWGGKYIENLHTLNVNAAHVKQTPSRSTGIAQINVADCGENQIVIVAGANNDLGVEDVREAKNLISEAKVLILQLETSAELAVNAMELCQGISILNGAPAVSTFDPKLLKLPTIFCVNETEAAVFTSLPVTTNDEAEKAMEKLIASGCNSVVLTLGAQGALYLHKDEPGVVQISCCPVQCVDSTGAGDAFIGALAYFLDQHSNLPMKRILECACFVATDSVTHPGTQISFPGPDILKLLDL